MKKGKLTVLQLKIIAIFFGFRMNGIMILLENICMIIKSNIDAEEKNYNIKYDVLIIINYMALMD